MVLTYKQLTYRRRLSVSNSCLAIIKRDDELVQLLSTSWRAIKDNVARARISELRKEGRLIPNDGRFSLSGAGVQWITTEVLPRFKQQTPP